MLKWCLLLSMLSGAAFAAEAREVYYQGLLTPQNIVPTFDKGYLIVYDREFTITVYAPDGSQMFSQSARVPNASWSMIVNAAADSDGIVAAAVKYIVAKHGEGGGIAVFDRAGFQTTFFNTGEFWPTQVSFGPDHSIWVIGRQWPRRPQSSSDVDYSVLRNYSVTGREIGAFLPRSSFDPQPEPVDGPRIGGWRIRVASGRVGALFNVSSGAALWVETDLQGKELRRVVIEGDHDNLAFTSSGSVYGQPHGVAILDHAGHWRPVAGMPDGTLLGADGDNLVFHLKGQSTLRWVLVSQ